MSFCSNFATKLFFIVVTVIYFTVFAYWNVTNYTETLPPKFLHPGSDQDLYNSTSAIAPIHTQIKPEGCQCFSQKNRSPIIKGSESLCQYQTTQRGLRTKIVSYSLEGDVSNAEIFQKYFKAIDKIALQIKVIYPGWVMRIYHNYKATDIAFTKYLCLVYCHNDHVDLCNVTDLENTSQDKAVKNISVIYSRLWRFIPIVDPTVDIFLSRDIDSNVTKREGDAENEWLLQSNKTLHVMRDNQYHSVPILAGMWGARMNTGKRDGLRNWFLKTKEEAVRLSNTYDGDRDQDMLASILHAVESSDLIRHESFYCTEYPNVTRPFPTQRVRDEFVGARIHENFGPLPKCSPACRPKDHQEWEYC